ncbi:MAG: hypothetical protein JOZ05_19200, partial [Acetobacteraceae bacterium]|nr:hypothetical protein [Acetobacteraceae bacterium]
ILVQLTVTAAARAVPSTALAVAVGSSVSEPPPPQALSSAMLAIATAAIGVRSGTRGWRAVGRARVKDVRVMGPPVVGDRILKIAHRPADQVFYWYLVV